MTAPVSLTRTRITSRSTVRSAHQRAPVRDVPVRTPAELAQAIDLEPTHTARLLEEWRYAGVVELVEPGRYALTAGGLGIARRLEFGRHEDAQPLEQADRIDLEDELPELRQPATPATTCARCGETLRPSVVQRRGRYCGQKCRQGAHRERTRGAPKIDTREDDARGTRDARRLDARGAERSEPEVEVGAEAPPPARKVVGVPVPLRDESVPPSGYEEPR